MFCVNFSRKKLFSTVHNFIHLNLSISLFMAYVIFAVGIEMATSNQVGKPANHSAKIPHISTQVTCSSITQPKS